MALPTGDPDLVALATSCKVPEEYISCLDGLNTELFACIATAREGLDKALEDLLADSPIPSSGPERVRLLASLRLLWERCGSSNAVPGTLPSANPGSSTWSEPFPPKLSGEAINQLRRTFASSYPGEILDADCMPSNRMMALASKLSQAGELRWIAWKHRLSRAQEEAVSLKRPAKVPRLEELFYDEIPCRELPQGQVGHGFVQGILSLVSTSFALLGTAHLHNLRMRERKFVKLDRAKSALEGRVTQPPQPCPCKPRKPSLLQPFSLTPGQSICPRSSLPKPWRSQGHQASSHRGSAPLRSPLR